MAKLPIRVKTKRPTRFFYGWWIVIIGSIQDAIRSGTFRDGFLFYFLPITRELNLSRAATSFAFSLKQLEEGFGGPLAG